MAITVSAAGVDLAWIVGPSIGVLGALIGTLLGAVLTRGRERLVWQRQWLTERIGHSTTYAADTCRAIDHILLVYGQCADAVAGKRGPVPADRVAATDEAWRDVLTTRYVHATEGLQEALTDFDVCRAALTDATNARAAEAIAATQTNLIEARVRVLDEIQRDRNEINQALAQYAVSAPVRWWLAIRDRPAYPHSPLPSEQRAAAERTDEAPPAGR